MVEYVVTVQTCENIAQLDILSKSEAEAIIKSNQEKKKQEEGEEQNSNPQKRPINDIRNEFKEESNKKEEKSENNQ